jgi:hypothetical protein
MISETFKEHQLLKYFNSMLYNQYFMPDINGYVLIYLNPPHLSGYNLDVDIDKFFGNVGKMSVFLATDIAPPARQITVAEVAGSFGAIPYGTKESSTGQLNITYIDNANLEIFSAHKLWIDYIRDVTLGEIAPDPGYMGEGGSSAGQELKEDWLYIDYMASAFVVKFRPSVISEPLVNNIVFVAKITGIFPITEPTKEVIGRRDSNEITILPFTYSISKLDEVVIPQTALDSSNQQFLDEFLKLTSFC